jgi:drug/metabolite transporter (DMT)-like permease
MVYAGAPMNRSLHVHQPFAPIAALLVNALIWGLSWYPFRHLDSMGLHSLWTTAWIYAFAALLIGARYPSAIARVLRSRWLLLLALASGLTNAFFNWGVTVGEVVRVVLLFYLMPVWAVLLARWLLAEPIGAGAVLRVLLAVAGASVVLWQPGETFPLPRSLPDWLGLAGGVAFALTNVLLRRQAADPTQARAMAMFAGGVLVPGTLASVLALSPTTAALVGGPTFDAGIAVVATLTAVLFLVANLSLQYGAARLPTSVTAVVMLSEVPFAALSAVVIGGEQLSVRTLAGGAMIVAASALAAFSKPRSTQD